MNAIQPTRHRTLCSVLLDMLGSTTGERNIRIAPATGFGSWHWLYVDRNGVAIAGPRASFATQDAAESWADINSSSLRALGISAITLRDGEHAIYGPTSV
jgi:hypothetical protein